MGNITLDPGDVATASGGDAARYSGWKISIGSSDITLVSALRSSGNTATTITVWNEDKDTQLASETIVGDTATFSNVELSANTSYHICTWNAESTYTHKFGIITTPVTSDSNITIDYGLDNGTGTPANFGAIHHGVLWDIEEITYNLKEEGDVITSGTVFVGTGTVGTKIMDKNYPYEEGLIAGLTKQT